MVLLWAFCLGVAPTVPSPRSRPGRRRAPQVKALLGTPGDAAGGVPLRVGEELLPQPGVSSPVGFADESGVREVEQPWEPEPGRFFSAPARDEVGVKVEPWVPEPGRFFGTPAAPEVEEEVEERPGPEPGRFFGEPAVVTEPNPTPAGGGLSEGYWAPLAESPDRLRSSDLNELLQPDHLERLRYANNPLMAYGALFKWEVLMREVSALYVRPWALVAAAHDLPEPDADDVLRVIGMRPERAIQQVFGWTDDWGFTQQLAFEHFEQRASVLESFEFECSDGAREWLELLQQYSVPCCCCCSTLDEATARASLSRAGIEQYFEAVVTAEDGCETPEQTYLLSSLKVRRPPERCVVFEDDPRGIAAAHDSTTKAVAVVGSSRSTGFELRHADMRVGGLDDLSLMSLRELFQSLEAR